MPLHVAHAAQRAHDLLVGEDVPVAPFGNRAAGIGRRKPRLGVGADVH